MAHVEPINRNWKTCSSEYTQLHLLVRPNSVLSFIFTPLITFIMVNIALSESFFLKNVLISDRKFVSLRTSIGILSLLVWYLKDTHFLRNKQGFVCFFCDLF